MVNVTVIAPHQYYGAMMEIIKEKRGVDIDIKYLDDGNVLITSDVPWQEVVCDMSDQISNQSSGYASFNYDTSSPRKADLVKVEIALNHDPCDPLSFIAHSTKAVTSGRVMCAKLKEVIARQQFEISIQAKINSKVRVILYLLC
jgi:GTP-binding protein LepA